MLHSCSCLHVHSCSEQIHLPWPNRKRGNNYMYHSCKGGKAVMSGVWEGNGTCKQKYLQPAVKGEEQVCHFSLICSTDKTRPGAESKPPIQIGQQNDSDLLSGVIVSKSMTENDWKLLVSYILTHPLSPNMWSL